MLTPTEPSPYDLQFHVLGFPVRIAWSFWLMAALLGWGWSQTMDAIALGNGIDTPGAAVMLGVWAMAVLLTILVHELGHALAWRHYGQEARIVLYHFGGLAVNDSFTAWDGGRRRRTTANEQLVVSAAGPAAQLLLALVVWLIGLAAGIPMQMTGWFNWLGLNLPMGTVPSTIVVYGFVDALLWTSVFWAVLNLAPIFPLDGGQILYNIFVMTGVASPRYKAHIASVVVGVALALVLFSTSFAMAGLMFLALAASNWQQAQQSGGMF
jgi:stage IV sporulation protein FB